ncbi:MAG: ribonuclease HII [Thermodesulfovibrionales bacterium]|nr:ribonuclease HII [Thermodesulfovibrionales bacterium]
MDIYRHDDALRERGFRVIAGIDEAGRGPIAGPVVAGAVILPGGLRLEGLRDSKLVPEAERKTLFLHILSSAIDIGIGICDVDMIERVNILNATRLAMGAAVRNLSLRPDLLLIDAVEVPAIPLKQFNPVKGESKSALIAAASIVAKVARDSLMYHYHEIYPEYGFDRHKGYCTEGHMKMLRLHGPSRIHRKGFQKVMSLSLPF